MWTEIRRDSAESWPGRRYGHSAVLHGRTLVVFGGKDPEDKVLYNDVWAFDLDRRVWTLLASRSKIQPLPRYGASAALSGDERLLIFGGSTSQGRTNDLWEFDFQTQRWAQLGQSTSSAAFPGPRSDAGAVFVSGPESAQNGSARILTKSEYLVIFGGNDGRQALSDIWLIDVGSVLAQQMGALPRPLHSPAVGVYREGPFELGELDCVSTVFNRDVNVRQYAYSGRVISLCLAGGHQGQSGPTAVVQPVNIFVLERGALTVRSSASGENVPFARPSPEAAEAPRTLRTTKRDAELADRVSELEKQLVVQQFVIKQQQKTIQDLDKALNQFVECAGLNELKFQLEQLREENRELRQRVSMQEAGQIKADQRLERLEAFVHDPVEQDFAQSAVEVEPVVSQAELLDENGNIDINKLEKAL